MIRTDGRPTITYLNSQQRAAVKEASRRADAQALAAGQKSHAQLISENSIFSGLAKSARVKKIRVRPGVPDNYIAAMRRLHPQATIIIPPEEEAA